MRRPTKRMLVKAGAVLASGAIALVGVSAASAAPAWHTRHIEHLQFMTTSPTSSAVSVIATGVFTAGGVDHESGGAAARLVFPRGTIYVHHSSGTGRQSFNPRTCLLTVNEHGTFRLVGGTGRYAGISGHGTYRLHILAIAARSRGRCSTKGLPVAFQQVIWASGPVHL